MHRPRPLAPALTLAAILASSSLASAQTPPAELTFSEALQRATSAPTAVRVALARAQVNQAQIGSAEAAYYPSVSLSVTPSLRYSESPPFVEVLPRQTTVNVSVPASARASLTLYDFGRTANNVQAAERGASAAREDTRAAVIQAIAAVATAYLTVLSDREAIAAVRATIAQREAHLRIAEGLVTIGTRPPIDRLRATVDLDVSRLDLTTQEAREQSDRASLASALGIDPTREVNVAPVDDNALEVNDDPVRAAEGAVANRAEFRAARERIAQTEAQLAAARSGRNPILAVQGDGAIQYTAALEGNAPSGISQSASATLALSWPIFDPTVRANIRVAEANVAVARENLNAQTLQVRTAAVQAAISARSARLALEQSERLAAGAAATLDSATGRYQSGAAPLLELIDAQATDASARIAVVRARLSWHLARVNLLAATGQIENLARPR
jgi:outer membrane protein TolC